jgi:hypothetical protein
MIAWWTAHHDGVCMPGSFLHYSPLDLANALRGNALFTDIYDRPDDVTALLDRCTEAIIAMEEEMRTVCRPQVEGVGMPFWGAMGPPGALYMSEDAMDLSGPKVARQWGLPWSTRVRDHFGCVAVHHHMLGRRVQPVIGQYVQKSVIQIANDPNCPPAFDHLAALAGDSNGNALMCDCSPEQILANLDRLKGVRAILITGTSDPARAAEVVAAVRSISNIR